jgi:hypothetical protein
VFGFSAFSELPFSTIPEQQVVPVVAGGGNGRQSYKKKAKGWAVEREILEASLARFFTDATESVVDSVTSLAKSDSRSAQRVAKSVASYDGEVKQLQKIQTQISQLQRELLIAELDAEKKADLEAAAATLKDFLLDEEEIAQIAIELDAQDAKMLLLASGVIIH